MRTNIALVFFTCAVGAAACGGHDGGPDLSPGVSWALAAHRAASISEVRYNLSFEIPRSRDERITGRAIVSFTLADDRDPLVLDFKDAATNVSSVKIEGRDVAYETVNDHVVVPGDALLQGPNTLEIEFLAGDGSVNRNDDFLYTLFVPDRARLAFPVFDQPNLKAAFALTLGIPADWRAVSNGPSVSHEITGDRARVVFADTKPISSYLFSFVAGRFSVETDERDGRAFRMYHRETDDAKVARNRDAVFGLHAAALRWLEQYADIEYPFDKFDFVLIPAFQYGGMEHPGAIQYRQSRILLDQSPTQEQLLGRASLIAHETAHMWFGDLVTMAWFDDVWLKEVFANFMAAKVVNPSFPNVDHDLRFFLAHYPIAYDIDRTRGANPIRQPLENLSEAGTLYGPIIYQKAPIVMKHLERLMGAAAFRDGLREYLTTFSFRNATWGDLVALLDRRVEADLVTWSAAWVEQSGRPSIQARVLEESGTVTSLIVEQRDSAGRGRVWTQRLELEVGYHGGESHRLPVTLDRPSVEIPAARGLPSPDYVLPNGSGVGYGHFILDDQTIAYFLEHLPTIEEAGTRGVVWVSLWDATLTGRVAPQDLVATAMRALTAESDALNAEQMVGDLTTAYWRYLTAAERQEAAPDVEELLWRLTRTVARETMRAAYFRAFRSVALTDGAVARLRRIWNGEATVPGVTLSESDLTALAGELAIRDSAAAEDILRRQLARIENPDRHARFEFIMPALSPNAETRDRFFESLLDAGNREHEPWVLDGLRYLHHPLRALGALHYIRPSLEVLDEIQRTGDIFFPQRWLSATLDSHNSSEAARIVREYLDSEPNLSPRLLGKLWQSADPLFVAAEMVN